MSVTRQQALAVALAAAVWLVGCPGTGPDVGGAPRGPARLVLQEATYDFGRVRQGATVRHTFRFENRGDLDLSIDNLRSACDCSAAVRGDRVVPAGGAAGIHVAFDTDGVFGRQRRTVTIYANDPENRVTVVTLTGDVTLDVVADPPQLYVGGVRRGVRVRREVALLSGDDPVRITSIVTEGPQLTVLRVVPAGGRAAGGFAVIVSPEAPLGPFHQDIEVRTTSVRRPVFTVPVAGVVEPDLIVSPPGLVFGAVERGTRPMRHALVENHGDAPVRVTRVQWDARLGQAEIDTVRTGFRYRLRAVLRDGVDPGDLTSVVRIHTDHPREAVIEIPVEGRVREGSMNREGKRPAGG